MSSLLYILTSSGVFIIARSLHNQQVQFPRAVHPDSQHPLDISRPAGAAYECKIPGGGFMAEVSSFSSDIASCTILELGRIAT